MEVIREIGDWSRSGACANFVSTHVLRLDNETCEEKCLDKSLSRFWDVETLGIFEKHEDVFDNFENNLRFEDGRYVVNLPFKPCAETLPDNFGLAKHRLINLKKKLDADHQLPHDYAKVIADYKQQGIVEEVDDRECEPGRVHYLPHRGVIREDKETSKLRIVFDASSHVQNQPSLNDVLYSGPCLLPLLYDVLLRFRIGKIGLVADIRQAFLQILVTERHRDFLRFLWFDDIEKDDPKLIIMRFLCVIFGVIQYPVFVGRNIDCPFEQMYFA